MNILLDEKSVQKKLAVWFKINSYAVIEQCIGNPFLFNDITECRTHDIFGIDIVAKKNNKSLVCISNNIRSQMWIIEVKGETKGGKAAAISNFYYGIGQIITRMSVISTNVNYALAVPNTDNFAVPVKKFLNSPALQILNLSIILVQPNGNPIFLNN